MIEDRATQYAKDVVSKKIIAGPHVRDSCKRHLRDLKEAKNRGFYWNLEKANRIIEFAREICKLNGGDFENKPFEVLEWQAFVLMSLFGWVKEDGTRRFKKCFIEAGKGPLALTTPVMTLNGWSTIEKIQKGDFVFNAKGEPVKVIGKSDVFYNHDCYELTFSDGEKIVSDADHEWETKCQRNYQTPGPRRDLNKTGNSYKRTTKFIHDTLLLKPSTSIHPQAKYNHSIQIAGPLQFEEKSLPIPSYTLGAWLGDGDTDCARITNARKDYQIIEEIIKEGITAIERCRYNDETTARYILGKGVTRSHADRNSSLSALLRRNNLIGNKHIPRVYFYASIDQRLALLQGLMDTDGSITKNGNCEFSITHEILCNDVLELLRGLGFKVSIRESDAKLNGRFISRRWRICFKAFSDFPVFRLRRKADRLRKRSETSPLSLTRRIINSKKVESVPVQCIEVDDPEHIFLCGKTLIPTGNCGKSPLSALVGIYGLVADNEPRAEIYAVASHKEQAQILFRDAVAMRNQSPYLKQRLVTSGTGQGVWNLAYLEKAAFFRPIAADTAQSGYRPHIVLCDEIHEMRSGNLIEMMVAGMKGRRQPLIFMITNSGFDKQSVCWHYHEYATKVAKGALIDDTFFSYVCALDKSDKPLEDDSCWGKANPSLGVTIRKDYLEEQVNSAKGMPSKQSVVERLNFCVWVGASNPWLSFDVWMSAKAYIDESELINRRCFGGLDLSSVHDLTALVLAFEPTSDDPYWRLLPFFWLPEEGLYQKGLRDGVDYLSWVKDGHLEVTPGKAIDKSFVCARLAEISSKYNLAILGYDRWRIDDLRQHLQAEGININLQDFGQGFKDMAPAVDEFERRLIGGQMTHNGNPCLTWCAANAVIVSDPANNRKPAKDKSTGRIDGIVAAVMAIGKSLNQVEEVKSEIIFL